MWIWKSWHLLFSNRDRGYPIPFSMSAHDHSLLLSTGGSIEDARLQALLFLGGLIDWDAKHTTKRAIVSGALDFTSNDAQERKMITPEDWGNHTLGRTRQGVMSSWDILNSLGVTRGPTDYGDPALISLLDLLKILHL